MQESYRTSNIVFGSLIFLTLFSWLLGWPEVSSEITADSSRKIDHNIIFFILLGIAIIKVQLIGDYFMHLSSVTGLWRWVISFWVLITGSLISITFIF